ncbi:MAG: EAL domain-containing protein, partial [Oscillospiraceae bacterium]
TITSGKRFYFDIYENENNHNLEMLYGVPIYNNNSNLVGILTATSTIDKIVPITGVSSSEHFLLNEKGDIIYSHPKQTNFVQTNFYDSIKESNKQFYVDEFLKLINNQTNNKKTLLNYNSCDYYAFSSSVGLNNWRVITLVPQAQYKEEISDFYALVVIPLGVVILLFALWSLFFKLITSKYNQNIEEITQKDSLTKLWNSNKILETINNILSKNKRNYWLFIIDIKKFKIVNDNFGFENGDKSLVEIAQILKQVFETNNIARMSDDNFIVLATNINYDDIKGICKIISARVGEIKSNDEICMKLVPSIGIYKIEDDCKDASSCVDRAIIARSTIKGSRISTYAVYDEMFREQLLYEREIEDEMQTALDNREFKVYFQPKVSVATGKYVGAEALIRWESPKRGLIRPDCFIPIFERNSFIVEIDKFVLKETCEYTKDCIEKGIKIFPISVNLSRVHLDNPHFIDEYDEILSDYHFDRNLIEFELTENIFMDNFDVAVHAMSELKARGYCLSMDDFGSEYSSLSLLQSIPIDVLKLDRSFFNETTNSIKGKVVIKAVVQMAKELKIKVVAEGVEYEEQVDFLKEIGCDMAQGFYYAKPMPISKFREICKSLR